MKDLSLHILDIMQNSIEAEASLIKLVIEENISDNYLIIEIEDDGQGINKEDLPKVIDPFVTSRKTREVGLGLALLKRTASLCDGTLKLDSQKGKGTELKAEFKYDHIDRPPLGKMPETLITVITTNPELDIIYRHKVEEQEFIFKTQEIRKELENVKINQPEIVEWIEKYLKENLKNLAGGEIDK